MEVHAAPSAFSPYTLPPVVLLLLSSSPCSLTYSRPSLGQLQEATQDRTDPRDAPGHLFRPMRALPPPRSTAASACVAPYGIELLEFRTDNYLPLLMFGFPVMSRASSCFRLFLLGFLFCPTARSTSPCGSSFLWCHNQERHIGFLLVRVLNSSRARQGMPCNQTKTLCTLPWQ